MEEDVKERLARLEEGQEQLIESIHSLKQEVSTLADKVVKSRETSWPTIFSGIFLVIAVYAAAIRPIDMELERHAVILTDRTIVLQNIENRQFQVLTRLDGLEEKLRLVTAEGSPVVQNRLAVIENKLQIK